jgi:glycosyltransferase involved in cell wall biosynthesis
MRGNMKVTFYSNFMNHHQLPFSLAMDRLTGGKYTFVATEPIPQERLDMGYRDMNKQYPFILTTYDSDENAEKAKALALDSDVIITGSAPEMYTRMRVEQGKLTFRYSERIFKGGFWNWRTPGRIAKYTSRHAKYRNAPLYMLCTSAFAAADYSMTGAYLNKTYKWGYFPEVKLQDTDALMRKKIAASRQGSEQPRVSLLWVARLIGLKHPEAAVLLAEKLKKNGYRFNLNIIGNGPMERQLKDMIRDRNLVDCVQMLGAMSPDEVREHMEASDIFLFTSDSNEGWGAVLNEAMNSGCAVVASHAVGAVPFLIRDGENGLIYRSGDDDSLYERTARLIDDPKLRDKLGRNAYRTLADTWNAETAAERFLQLAQALRDGKSPDLFDEGPCSRAQILKNDWYKG